VNKANDTTVTTVKQAADVRAKLAAWADDNLSNMTVEQVSARNVPSASASAAAPRPSPTVAVVRFDPEYRSSAMARRDA
jgi:hypothetical protein